MEESQNTGKKKTMRYASIEDPTIEAIASEMFRFGTETMAQERLDNLKEHYIVSKHQLDNQGHPSTIMWIKGYQVLPEEEKKGYFGHYVMITYRQTEDGKFTLYGQKLDSDVKRHPQRKLLPQKHPNWGHPALRRIKSKKQTYATIEEAQDVLTRLHEDFPDVTIPNPGKLYAMVYSRQHNPPVQKYVFEIKNHDDGSFWIDWFENPGRPKKDPAPRRKSGAAPAAGEGEAAAPMGKFTSQVQLKRAKKGKKPPVPPQSDAAPPADSTAGGDGEASE